MMPERTVFKVSFETDGVERSGPYEGPTAYEHLKNDLDQWPVAYLDKQGDLVMPLFLDEDVCAYNAVWFDAEDGTWNLTHWTPEENSKLFYPGDDVMFETM